MRENIDFVAGVSERIDVLIAERAAGVSRSYAKKLLDAGQVLVNGQKVKCSYKTKAEDEISIDLPENRVIDAQPEDIPLSIIYEDEAVLVVNKPRGMVVHPASGNYTGTLVNAALFHCRGALSGINGDLRPGIVHRIDKDTTGLLVIAKNDEAHKALTAQLSDRSLSRTYYTLVHGNLRDDSRTIEAPIGRSTRDRKQMAVVRGGREAVTFCEVLERFGDYTLLRCKLHTGRTHQIRVHMKYIGHSVVGDKTYGVKNERFHLQGQLLHAGELAFIHPIHGEKVSFSCPLPDDFSHVLSLLRK